jgi:hypothetical protein
MTLKAICVFQAILLGFCLALPGMSWAHSALCSCIDNGDGSVTCEGGFSDGSSAAGVKVYVRQMDDRTLIRGKMDQNSEFTFKKPEVDYKVIFDAGPGHQLSVDGGDITQ